MPEKNRSKDQLLIRYHYIFVLIVSLHCLFYVVYWFAVGDFRANVDQFIAGRVGLNLPFTTILMLLTAVFGIWSLIRFFKFQFSFHKEELDLNANHWVYLGVGIFFLMLFYGSYVIILKENPSQRGVLFHLLNLTRLGSDALLFLLGAIWLRRLILYLRSSMVNAEPQWPWTAGIILSLLSLVGLWLLPAIFPPTWAYRGDLPAKPALIAHRGASMLAPENTLAAAELAAVHQALGFETDIRISLDGVPFLMHDETLARTTNIAEVYPERVTDRASSFTIDELKTLNAGLWFIQKDPYNMIESGLVSQRQLSINQGQKIPTLNEALEVVDNEGLALLFDIYYPPEDHPYHDDFFEIVFTQCRESGLRSDIWFLLDRDRMERVIEQAPQITRVAGVSSTNLPGAEALLALGYEIINVDIGIRTQEIRAYREKGLGVNVYTIDEPWLFSQFWLSGVTSVTTNDVQTFNQLDNPTPNLSYSRFLLFWGLFGIIVAIWLAGSPIANEATTEEPRQFKTPDLMDFDIGEINQSESTLSDGAGYDAADNVRDDQTIDDEEESQL